MRNTNRFGCLSGAGILASLVTLFLITGYVYAKGGLLYNPGPLNAQSGDLLGGVTSHAETGGNCKACHTAPWDSARMDDRCTDCHGEIAGQLLNVDTMHGSLMSDNSELSCRHCHPEHRGPDASLTEINAANFPHQLVGYLLDGHQVKAANEPFICSDCHIDALTDFELQTCDSCHHQIDPAFMDAHLQSFGPACLDCHDGADSLVTKLNHNAFDFKLVGEHKEVDCVKCHSNARGIGDFRTILLDCYSCHRNDDPHDGRFGIKCNNCHTANGWQPAEFDHNLASFKLEGEHAEVSCESCHRGGVYTDTPSDCYSCHQQDDEHNGRFGRDCGACHNSSDWEDAVFDHNLSAFPLTGRHLNLTCEQCHNVDQFAGLSSTCVSCHADPAFHVGMFGTDCGACHTTDNWFAPYTGRHPGIADEGGRGVNHGGASCTDCHTSTLHTATCIACHNSNNPEGEGDDD